jgi:hypothetical protein
MCLNLTLLGMMAYDQHPSRQQKSFAMHYISTEMLYALTPLPLLLLLCLLHCCRRLSQNCPVCCEFLFDSIRPISVLPCGHTIHQVSADIVIAILGMF